MADANTQPVSGSRLKRFYRGQKEGRVSGYKGRLKQYKEMQQAILNALVIKQKELAEAYTNQKRKTQPILGSILVKLSEIGRVSTQLMEMAERIETKESFEKNKKAAKKDDIQLSRTEAMLTSEKNQSKKVVGDEKKEVGELDTYFKGVSKKLADDENSVKEILVTVATIKLLMRYYWEVDEMIAYYRQKSLITFRKEKRHAEHEVHEEIREAQQRAPTEGMPDNMVIEE